MCVDPVNSTSRLTQSVVIFGGFLNAKVRQLLHGIWG